MCRVLARLIPVFSLVLFLALNSTSQTAPASNPLRIIVFGAHPDDCEYLAGGMAVKWAEQGHKVKFVSVTNGDAGHVDMGGGALAIRRTAEAKESAKVLGIESEVLDIHDGELMPTLENRRTIVKLIRDWQADIVIGHRPNDYHPDHRYVGILMQDAAFMVTVKHFLPSVPSMKKNPVFLYMYDEFQKPYPFSADVVVSIDDAIEKKIKALSKLESQIEMNWWFGDTEKAIPIPADPKEKEKFMEGINKDLYLFNTSVADKYRKELLATYGEEKGKSTHYAEAFELCEYGSKISKEELKKLFLIK